MSAATRWPGLLAFSDAYTCYSAAMAVWLAHEHEDWPRQLNPGLWLTVAEQGDGLFAFAHFPTGLRGEFGLRREGGDTARAAVDGVLAELERSGRVIVAGDGFHLPWHVAFGRRHVPHWFVLAGDGDRPHVRDPFACRNELGVQEATEWAVEPGELPALLPALPRADRVLALREQLAFGDVTSSDDRGWQWFVADGEEPCEAPSGLSGPAAVHALAVHFREHGQDPGAYGQADDLWSIARHRAFLARLAASVAARGDDRALAAWVSEHADPLAKRWSHMAPLIMQATLSLAAGRAASESVPNTLGELAARERDAAEAFPHPAGPGTI